MGATAGKVEGGERDVHRHARGAIGSGHDRRRRVERVPEDSMTWAWQAGFVPSRERRGQERPGDERLRPVGHARGEGVIPGGGQDLEQGLVVDGEDRLLAVVDGSSNR